MADGRGRSLEGSRDINSHKMQRKSSSSSSPRSSSSESNRSKRQKRDSRSRSPSHRGLSIPYCDPQPRDSAGWGSLSSSYRFKNDGQGKQRSESPPGPARHHTRRREDPNPTTATLGKRTLSRAIEEADKNPILPSKDCEGGGRSLLIRDLVRERLQNPLFLSQAIEKARKEILRTETEVDKTKGEKKKSKPCWTSIPDPPSPPYWEEFREFYASKMSHLQKQTLDSYVAQALTSLIEIWKGVHNKTGESPSYGTKEEVIQFLKEHGEALQKMASTYRNKRKGPIRHLLSFYESKGMLPEGFDASIITGRE